MRIIKAQVFDPVYLPSGSSLPPRMEILVEGVDLHHPTRLHTEGEWTVARYGDDLYLFWHEGDLGQKEVHNDEFDEEELVFHEGWFNAIGPLGEPVFPVTVTDGYTPMRDFFVPIRLVSEWLENLVEHPSHGHWELQADTDWALRGQIVFNLKFAMYPSKNI